MGLMAVLVAIIIGLAMLAVFMGIGSLLSRESVQDRIQEIVRSDVLDTGGARSESAVSSKHAFKQLDRELASRGLGRGITANLLQADLKMTATEYMLLVVSITVLGALLGYAISRQPISALVAGTVSFFGPGMILAWRKAKRRRAFADQLPEALTQMSGSLRAGFSVAQSLDTITRQLPWPSKDEFARVVREIQLGQSLQAALIHLSERIPGDDLIMVITSINIHQQIGGNLAEILETVAETIRERIRIKREIQVLTAQQRISGYVLVALPIAMGAFLLIINPEYEMRLFTPGPTLCIPIGAAISMVVGYIAMQRIIDIDV
jgi:tight adherence protein B